MIKIYHAIDHSLFRFEPVFQFYGALIHREENMREQNHLQLRKHKENKLRGDTN